MHMILQVDLKKVFEKIQSKSTYLDQGSQRY